MTMQGRLLVVDDEKLIRLALREKLEEEGFMISEAGSGAEAMKLIKENEYDLVLLDYKLPDLDGIEILKKSLALATDPTFIIMTAYSTVESAVEAMKLGAFDYINKPFNFDSLKHTIRKALERSSLKREVTRLRSEQMKAFVKSRIIGNSQHVISLLAWIDKVAESAATTILIEGESGTGKDLVARTIHYNSSRRNKPFMNITCSAISETLLESELFGHEKGAFTDAKKKKIGLFEAANGGTVYLDEIGEMGLSLQSKLLRFLEEKTFMRVGGLHDISVDVRVIAATNKNLEKETGRGNFREDLYYRLKVIPITLAPLRERKEDIPLIIDHFIKQYNTEFRKKTSGVSNDALAVLMDYNWPGNIRELRNLIERIMILENKEFIEKEDLPQSILERASLPDSSRERDMKSFPLPEKGVSLEDVEKNFITQALQKTGGNQTRAARLLRMTRDAFRYRMKKFGILH